MDDEEGEISLYSMLSEIKLHNIIRVFLFLSYFEKSCIYMFSVNDLIKFR